MGKKSFAFIFPGQGAQAVGMGKAFYDTFSEAKEIYEQADALLGRFLSKTIFEGPIEELTETKNSQSGLYVTSIAICHVLKKQFPNLKPVSCAGLSLGEYSALTCAGILSFDQGVSMVQTRGLAMNRACEDVKGTMAALFGLSGADVEAMVSELKLPNDLWVANYNCPGQVVISGTLKGVEAGIEAAKARGAKRTIALKVHGAFHSGLMQSAEKSIQPHIEQLRLLSSDIQVAMNVPGTFVSEIEQIKRYLIAQVTHAVKWEQCIGAMSGVDYFVEIGSGKTLAGLNRQIEGCAPTLSINTPSDLETLAKAIG